MSISHGESKSVSHAKTMVISVCRIFVRACKNFSVLFEILIRDMSLPVAEAWILPL